MPRVRKTTGKSESHTDATQQGKEKKQKYPQNRHLYRSSHNRIIAGVAGGLGDYFALDPLLIRIIFILLTFFANGIGVLLYIVLWILLPEEGQEAQNPRDTIHANMQAFREDFRKAKQDISRNSTSHRHLWGGILLLIVGILFLTNNFGFFYGFSFHLFWPIILILLGIFLIYKHK